ncbi:MAG: DUF1330 domain-containing protein, partial [Bryobacterales bacterium]|nr:DUF1330 domain-containing protein [Bryobacterales bacterium]
MSTAARMRENGNAMGYEMMVALAVVDQARYAAYRSEMTPLLEAAGGGFRYDFEVSKELKPSGEPPINRVFVIAFPSKTAKEAFFADSHYMEIRARHFTQAVARTVWLGEQE